MTLQTVLIILFFAGKIFSQQKVSLLFIPVFKGSGIEAGKYYKLNEKDSMKITSLKFYASGIELWHEQKPAWKEKNSYHLVDISDSASMRTELNVPAVIFSEVRFKLGIDSLTNVSGAMGGTLDPVKGMYWTWQSGYINFKLEGNSNLCKTRNNGFQYHLGGYQNPFYCLQEVKLAAGGKRIKVIIDLEKIIDPAKLAENDHIMSPCREAVLMSEKIAGSIHAQ